MAMVSALCSLIALLKVSNDASDTGCLAVARKIPFSRALLSLSFSLSCSPPLAVSSVSAKMFTLP